MRKSLRREVVCFLSVVVFFLIALLPGEVRAEGDMRTVYPKFRLTGLIELDYLDYSTSTTQNGIKSESKASTFEQYYRLGALGYVITPKLVVYSVDVAFRDAATNFNNNGFDFKEKDHEINYDLYAGFLRERPINLDVYATRSTGTVSDGAPTDITSNTYGLVLRLSLDDLLKKKAKSFGPVSAGGGPSPDLPIVRLEYNHVDLTFGNTGTSDVNSYGVDIIGQLKPIRTRYILVYQFLDYSSPVTSYSAQYASANTETALGSKNTLSTSFQYSSAQDSSYTFASASLALSPNEHFSHSYIYDYLSVETGAIKSTSHYAQGIWDYRFTNRLDARGSAYYNLVSNDGQSTDSYGTSIGASYGRPIKDLDFNSLYRFSYVSGSFGENFIENNVDLILRTRKLKWGMIYGEYSLTYDRQNIPGTTEQSAHGALPGFEGTTTEQIARVGVRGTGPGRAYWNVEAEYDNLSNEQGGLSAVLPGGPQELSITGPLKASYYSVTPEVGYPLGRKGLLVLLGNYTSGEANSQPLTRYYYEARLNYYILRNLTFIAWWRDGWDKVVESGVDRRIWIGEARLYYRLRKLFLSLEYRQWKSIDMGPTPTITEERRLFLRLARPI